MGTHERHGHASGPGRPCSPEYRAWYHMRQRCTNPRIKGYANYGGRGISVCERWQHFANFLADMGPKPYPKATLERLDNDGNYEPGNCAWRDRSEQIRNRRPHIRIIHRYGKEFASPWRLDTA